MRNGITPTARVHSTVSHTVLRSWEILERLSQLKDENNGGDERKSTENNKWRLPKQRVRRSDLPLPFLLCRWHRCTASSTAVTSSAWLLELRSAFALPEVLGNMIHLFEADVGTADAFGEVPQASIPPDAGTTLYAEIC